MRRWMVLGVLLLGLATPGAQAQGAAEDAIRDVIARQIEAFKADDFETAFDFASPAIKRMFGTPDRFGQMVQSGYPMVWRPATVRFAGLAPGRGTMIQGVVITDAAGGVHLVEYHMIEDADGWRINGVLVRRPGDAGA